VTAGQTVTVSYTVTAKSGTTGDGILLNMLGPTTGTPPTTCTPTTDPAWACTVHPIKGSFSLVKSSVPASGAQVSPGDTITYKVIAQDANGPVTGVVIKDDLTTVLNNATFVPGSAKLTIGTSAPISVPDPTGTNPILLQSAPFNLAAGQSATLTYQVTVKANAWSKTLVNVVTGFSDGNVPPTSCAPCTTTHATPAMLLIEKIGESSSSTWVPMDGSSWAVFNDNAGQQGTPYSGTGITPVLPKAVGMFQLQNIPAGTYWLTETSAPAGFNLLAEPVQFTIAANGAVSIGQGAGGGVVTAGDLNGAGIFTITVRDVPALQLPESGGTGTLPFLAGGSILLLASAALFIGSQRRRRTQGMDAV
jgi:trimeric autotransporter adhesin